MNAVDWTALKKWMEDGECEKAELALAEVRPRCAEEARKTAHYRARLHGLRGEDARAIEELAPFQDRGTSNFLARIEYASALYRTGNTPAWEKSVQGLAEDFEVLREKLSEESFMNGIRFLVGAHEELGRVPLALDLLELGKADCEHRPGGRYAMFVLNEIVRVQATYGISSGLGDAYRLLSSFKPQLGTKLFERERLHALLLAEIELFGWESAERRFAELTRDPKVTEQFFSLVAFDSFEALLRRGHGIPAQVAEAVQLAEPTCAFERVLRAGLDEEQRWMRYLAEKDAIPLASRLRLLALFDKDSARAESGFLRSSLDSRSARFWEGFLGTRATRLELRERKAIFGKLVLDLRKKPASWALLDFFRMRRSAALEELVVAIWQENFCPQHYDRLRILISRTNKALAGIGLGADAIEFTKTEIRLRSGLSF